MYNTKHTDVFVITWWSKSKYNRPTLWLKTHIPHLALLDELYIICFNTLRPRQNGRHFVDDTFKRIFLKENVEISIKISMKFVPKGPINNIPALVQIMAWRRTGDKPLSEQMMTQLNDAYMPDSASMS